MSEVARFYAQQSRERRLTGSLVDGKPSLRPIAQPIVPQNEKLKQVLAEISATVSVDPRVAAELAQAKAINTAANAETAPSTSETGILVQAMAHAAA